ncbi:UNVERIFIED_CONTAM: hypothetical protein RF653_10175 [Kocuria sp. CPCC 205316]|uniref:hypothetical protein n=1 Tax=Kocuria TaxID=57493 RepID=UPI0036DB0BCC
MAVVDERNVWVFYFPAMENIINVLTLVLLAMAIMFFVLALQNERRRKKLINECEAFLREPQDDET